MKYRITFTHGGTFEFDASSMDDDGNRLRLLDEDGGLVIAYQDSDIESCVEFPEPVGALQFAIEKSSGAVDTAFADAVERSGAVIRFVTAGRVVASYRSAHAHVKEMQDG
jgi:hypothetical protein